MLHCVELYNVQCCTVQCTLFYRLRTVQYSPLCIIFHCTRDLLTVNKAWIWAAARMQPAMAPPCIQHSPFCILPGSLSLHTPMSSHNTTDHADTFNTLHTTDTLHNMKALNNANTTGLLQPPHPQPPIQMHQLHLQKGSSQFGGTIPSICLDEEV